MGVLTAIAQTSILVNATGNQRPKPTRISLSGVGGSGKTTVAHWLACCVAERSFTAQLDYLNDAIPFVAPLRRIFAYKPVDYVPSLEELVPRERRTTEMPGNWIRDQLGLGRAFVIFDGLDELSGVHQTRALDWIMQTANEFPRSHYIVTSRPDVNQSSLNGKFAQLELQPLSHEGTNECIRRWFSAMDFASPESVVRTISEAKNRLLEHVNTVSGVRDLAETPLICAMLCAYYASKRTAEATTRSDLFESVIVTLAHEREATRGSADPKFRSLDASSKLALLGAVAHRMSEQASQSIGIKPQVTVDANRARLAASLGIDPMQAAPVPASIEQVVESTTITEVIEGLLPAMPLIRYEASQLANHLVSRSIVLIQTGLNEAQFAHRTIQEYLTARHAAALGGIDAIIDRIARGEGGQVPVFAAARATEADRSRLISAILDLVDSATGQKRRDLLLLGAECTAAAIVVSPKVAARITESITSILPPTSVVESSSLTSFGEWLIPWLSGHFTEPFETRRACILTLAAISGGQALQAISEYAEHGSDDLFQDFLECWPRFDATAYLSRVLKDYDLAGVTVPVTGLAMLEAVGQLQDPPAVRAEMHDGPVDLNFLRDVSRVIALDCSSYHRLSTIGSPPSTGLKRLSLRGQRNISSLDGLQALAKLREIYLDECHGLRDITALRDLQDLRILVLDGCTGVKDFQALEALHELRTLSVAGCDVRAAEVVSRLRSLRTLRANYSVGLEKNLNLADLSNLLRLHIRIRRTLSADPLECPRGLREIEIFGGTAEHAAQLLDQTRLRRVAISNALGTIDGGALIRGLPQLQHLELRECVVDLSSAASSSSLVSLNLTGSDLESFTSLGGMSRLESVVLDSTLGASDLTPLTQSRQLRRVSLLDVPSANTHVLEEWFGTQCEIFMHAWDRVDLGGN